MDAKPDGWTDLFMRDAARWIVPGEIHDPALLIPGCSPCCSCVIPRCGLGSIALGDIVKVGAHAAATRPGGATRPGEMNDV